MATTMTAMAAGGRDDEAAARPLRVCCYGSSSSRTPKRYTDAAYALGRALARRGHTCVNGAGSSGCMAAMNRGADDAGGRIVGVIHEAFVAEGGDWFEGAHPVFRDGRNEVVVARGNNLRERKRLLVEGADALAVLPGGPGTWDELWEMACARHIGFHSMPIVCVNVDGYYDTFVAMLERAHEDGLLYKHPSDIVHFEQTSEQAVRWIEEYLANLQNETKELFLQRESPSVLKRLRSNVSGSSMAAWGRLASFFGDGSAVRGDDEPAERGRDGVDGGPTRIRRDAAFFSAGLALGLLIAFGRGSRAR